MMPDWCETAILREKKDGGKVGEVWTRTGGETNDQDNKREGMKLRAFGDY